MEETGKTEKKIFRRKSWIGRKRQGLERVSVKGSKRKNRKEREDWGGSSKCRV